MADSAQTPGWFDLVVALVLAALVLACVFHPDPDVRSRAGVALVIGILVLLWIVM